MPYGLLASGESVDAGLLSHVPLFDGLSADQLAQVASLAREQRASTGHVFFREGELGDAFFVLLEGNVRISKHIVGVGEEALAILEPGACFGEMALIDSFPRSADARAHSDCVVGVITKDDLAHLMAADRDLAHEMLLRFVRTLCVRLRETNDKIKVFFQLAGGF
jgi:CRP-like cAMP-binding protein